jgi:hypothetical protein
MVIHEEEDGVVAVGQPSHAWLSGQLARAWGNGRFGAVWPWEEVCLAAEQHDVGMAEWDVEPELDPASGHPRSFMAMALETHLELWSAAPGRVRTQSRYAALLVCMHGAALYEQRDLAALAPERAGLVRSYLDRQRTLAGELLAELRSDPHTAAAAAADVVARNARLVWTWDSLSLALLLDWAPHEVEQVPTAGDPVTLRVRDATGAPGRLVLEPWPFSAERVIVHCEGRRLDDRFDDEEAMQAALARAPWTTLRYELVPGSAA